MHRVQEDGLTPKLHLVRTKRTRSVWVALRIGSSLYYLSEDEALDLSNQLVDHVEAIPAFQDNPPPLDHPSQLNKSTATLDEIERREARAS